jgi:hypothetical protein
MASRHCAGHTSLLRSQNKNVIYYLRHENIRLYPAPVGVIPTVRKARYRNGRGKVIDHVIGTRWGESRARLAA